MFDVVVLPDLDRDRVWRWFMRRNVYPATFTKADLRAAVNAVDAWIDDNATSFNTALPQPFRSQATIEQKTLMLTYVAMRRAGILHVEEDG